MSLPDTYCLLVLQFCGVNKCNLAKTSPHILSSFSRNRITYSSYDSAVNLCNRNFSQYLFLAHKGIGELPQTSKCFITLRLFVAIIVGLGKSQGQFLSACIYNYMHQKIMALIPTHITISLQPVTFLLYNHSIRYAQRDIQNI